MEKHKSEGIESKGVKAHFSLDESGIFSLSHCEIVFEKNTTAEAEEDTLSKIGSAFSSLFSGKPDISSTWWCTFFLWIFRLSTEWLTLVVAGYVFRIEGC